MDDDNPLRRVFRIYKAAPGVPWANDPGRYLNSPPQWVNCGLIRAADEEDAREMATFIVGSETVKVEEYLSNG